MKEGRKEGRKEGGKKFEKKGTYRDFAIPLPD